MCKILGIPRSTYYSFGYKKTSKTALERELLKQEIQSIYYDSNGIYGAPKIHKILCKKFNVSIKRVQKIMSELCLKSVIIKKYMTTDLIIRTLDSAIIVQNPDEGLIFHSDLGSQYTSSDFSNCTSKNKIIQSFSKKGCPYDNACIESFHAILKKEEVYRVKYFDFESARLRLFKYIEGWYNRKRIHGSIGFISSEKCEKIAIAS